MSLTGVSPNDPRPSARRELIFASGVSSGSSKGRKILLYGNKTSAGSETVNVIGLPIQDDTNAIERLGRRSEAYAMYRTCVAAAPGAEVSVVCPTESAGTATAVDFVFATTATGTTSVEISFQGSKAYASVNEGDTATTIGAAVAAAINAADEGTWQCTAANVSGTVTITASQKGPRGDLLLGSTANVGMRMRLLKSVATTVTKGNFVAGTTEDDFTSAYSEASNGEYYYQASAKHATSTVSATDNGIGEHIAMIQAQALPINGKGQCAVFGLVGTQAQATAVAISGAANSVRAFFYHQENSDWSPGMIAAHHAGVMWSMQAAHPAANMNELINSDSQPYLVPASYQKADIPTSTEVTADLNNGVSSIGVNRAGQTQLIRQITSRSLNAQGNNDYRAREGHITSVMDFFWETVLARWESQKQPFVSDDLPAGSKPVPKTSTPSSLKGLLFGVIDDLAGPRPLGTYEGPILAPDKVDAMKKSIVVSKIAGGLTAAMDAYAVQHLIKYEQIARETSPAY